MEPPRIASRPTTLILPSNSERPQERALYTRNRLHHRILSKPGLTSRPSDVHRESTSTAQGSPATSKISSPSKSSTNELELEVARVLNGMKHNTVPATCIYSSPSALYRTVGTPATYILMQNSSQKEGQIHILVKPSKYWTRLKKNSNFKLPKYPSDNSRGVHVSDSAINDLLRHSHGENSQYCHFCSNPNTKLPFQSFDVNQDESVHWNGERAFKRRRSEEWSSEHWQSHSEDEGKEWAKNGNLCKGGQGKTMNLREFDRNRVDEARKRMRMEEGGRKKAETTSTEKEIGRSREEVGVEDAEL